MEAWTSGHFRIIWILSWAIMSTASGYGIKNNEVEQRMQQTRKTGVQCIRNRDCSHIINSECYNGECFCRQYYLPFNETLCVRASLLGFSCLLDSQCSMMVPNSGCDEGVCQCRAGFVPHRRDVCLSGAKVGEFCMSNQQCEQESAFSYCKFIIPRVYGLCTCPAGSSITLNKTCVSSVGSQCTGDEFCQAGVENSHCKLQDPPARVSVCTCPPGHSVTGRKCQRALQETAVVPVSLGRRCQSSSQCKARDPNSHCLQGACHCIKNTSACSASNRGCHKDTFQCRSGQCVSWYFVCNGVRNCEDGSDEDECMPFNCPSTAYQCDNGDCIARSKVCNGRLDCLDGSDEAKCYGECNVKSFRCDNGSCLPQYAFCNAIPSCKDGSDEDPNICGRGKGCPADQFQCNNGRCRSTAILCSGRNGCQDNSDEDACNVCFCKEQ